MKSGNSSRRVFAGNVSTRGETPTKSFDAVPALSTAGLGILAATLAVAGLAVPGRTGQG